MRGHIRQRTKDNKTWSIIIELEKVNGKRKQKWYTFKGTKKDAEKFLTEKLRELDNGLLIDNKMSFEEYLQHWYKECCIPNLSPNTYESYNKNIRLHITPILGSIELSKLSPLHLQRFYTNRLEYGLSKTTVLYLHKIIHSALEQAMKWQLVVRNIADNVEPPKKERYEAKVLNNEQLKVLIEKSKSSDIYIPIMIAISTGMRRGEILGLTWDNIDLEKETIKVNQALYKTSQGLVFLPPKTTKSNRIIVIPHTLTLLLQEHKTKQELYKAKLANNYNDANLVCCLDNGIPINPDTFTPKFCKFLKANNLPEIRFHDLRHSHASLLLKEHIEPKLISERLGHSNIGITMDLYSHIYEESNREVANTFNKLLVG